MEIKTIQKEEYDVIVVGGGIAGISAAVTAARMKAKVLLLEKQVNLGGLATNGLISWYEPLCDGNNKQIVFGIAEELLRLSVKYCFDSLPKKWGGTDKSAPRNDRYSTRFSPTVFSLVLDRFITENNVKILFDTYCTYPVMEGNVCKGVITENVDGRSFFPAKIVIDATGDASIMYRAGVPCRDGTNFLTYIIHDLVFSEANKSISENKTWDVRNWKNCGSDMFGNGHPIDMKKFKGTSCEDITEYMLTGKKIMLDKIIGRERFEYDISTIPTMPQLRTIRQIVGDGDFKAVTDIKVDDSIGLIGDFRYSGKVYSVPFSALYNSSFPNLLAAGRIISAPEYDDWEIARVIPTCALTGEAAGKAAIRYINNKNIKK